MPSRHPVLLTLLLFASAGMGTVACRTPRPSCPIRSFLGRPISEFIRTQGSPLRVLADGQDGAQVYVFEWSEIKTAPTPTVQVVSQPEDPKRSSDGWSALFQEQTYTGGKPPAVPFHMIRATWILKVRTDARGIIKDYSYLKAPGS